MEIESMKNRTEFILWYNSWGNKSLESNIFDYHSDYILNYCLKFKDIWYNDYKEYLIKRLSQ